MDLRFDTKDLILRFIFEKKSKFLNKSNGSLVPSCMIKEKKRMVQTLGKTNNIIHLTFTEN